MERTTRNRKRGSNNAATPAAAESNLSLFGEESGEKAARFIQDQVRQILARVLQKIDDASPEALVGGGGGGDNEQWREAAQKRRRTRDLLRDAQAGDPAALETLDSLIRAIVAQLLSEGGVDAVLSGLTRESTAAAAAPPDAASPVSGNAQQQQPPSEPVQPGLLRDEALERLARWLLDTAAEPEPGAAMMAAREAANPYGDFGPLLAQPEERQTPPLSLLPVSPAEPGQKSSSTATPQETRREEDFVLHTGQEMDAYLRAAADGHSGDNWMTDPQAGTRTHRLPGLSHFVRLELSAQERAVGTDAGALEQLTGAADADCMFALLYVSRVLAPPAPLPGHNTTAVDWIDLDDVADKIGLQPGKLNAEQRAQARRRIWEYLNFGARAHVVGSRSSVYVDRATGQQIQTFIDAPLWSFQGRERPASPPPGEEHVPRRVEIVISREWLRLITSPQTAQYLPMGELLGAIPPGKPSGSWARVIGLSLANTWRRLPREAAAGTLRLSRRELLSRYAAHVAPYEEVLGGSNPRRAIQYWAEALNILVEQGFLAAEGEAARGVALQGLGPDNRELPRKNWQQTWLDTEVALYPGPQMRPAVEACAHSLPPPAAPRSISAASKNAKKRSGK